MRIAVTSSENHLDGSVDPRFGRCRFFIVVDPETMEWEAVPNDQNLNAPQGAGIQAAANIAKYKPKAVMTGNCGPKAFQTLKSSGIEVIVGVSGTIRKAVEDYKEGKLKPSNAPNVSGHWM